MIDKKEAGIGKRGQSSVFIIAGIIIVIVAGLVVFFFREDVRVGERITTAQVEPVREYVEDCIREELQRNLERRREFGGRNAPDFAARKLRSDYPDYNVLNVPSDNLPSLFTIEREVALNIEDYLKNSCSLERFRENFNILVDEKNELNAKVSISDNIVTVNVKYPITIQKDDSITKIEEFNLVVGDKFGKAYRVVRNLLNGFDAGNTEPVSSYCFDFPDLVCNVVENSGGLIFVQVGDVDKFPKPEGNQFIKGDAKEVFTFVIYKI